MRIRPTMLAALAAAAPALTLALGGCGGSGPPQGAVTGTAGGSQRATSSAPAPGAGASSAGAATSGSQTTAVAGASASAGAAPPCVASGLQLSFLGGRAATGHGELGFALRNVGAAACTTIGYPGIQLLDRAGAALPTTPTHTTDDFFGHVERRELTVAPGQNVSFRIGLVHSAASDAGCATAFGLQVIAPNDTATLRVSIPGGAYECDGSATVSPVAAGGSAYP